MNNQRTSLLLCCFITLFIICCKKIDQTPIDLAKKIQEAKEYPNDLFSFQRSYPYKKMDMQAYEAGMLEATFLKRQRNITPGLDEAWTNQGPGNAGGRANTIAVHPTDENIMYLGFATGGVWKTVDAGDTWNPIFDDQPFQSVSDIALDPNDPETVYVGTGDANISGYPAIGDGVYKSTNGGSSWTHLGLSAQRIVSKIIIHPSDPNTIYVSCMGLPFERNNDRGLYKTIDGGINWEQVLFVSNQSGVIDMLMNPDDPNVLYAASLGSNSK